MRKIIIIQGLIILAGAYYIYTLQTSTVTEETTSIRVVPQTEQSAAPASEEQSSSVDDEESVQTTGEATITGPSDVGMEFPIPDDESDLR